MLVVQGWTILAHPLFLNQLGTLTRAVAGARDKNPDGYQSSANAKLLAALKMLAFTTIPQDPSRAEFRQGRTLGENNKHWFRAKFGNQRFRLFFRYNAKAKIIIYAWVNDANTLRTYGAKSDAYAVFLKMLKAGNPPDDWRELVIAASDPEALARLSGHIP